MSLHGCGSRNRGHMLNMSKVEKNKSRTAVTWYTAFLPELQPIIVCSNVDPRMTLTYFMARSILEI